MRQLLPSPTADVPVAIDVEVDVAGVYATDRRTAPAGRPWVMMNMIASVDGGTAIDGASGALGGPADKQVFHAIRGVADVVLVGAGTVRAENYGPPQTSDAQQAERRARGQAATPRLAVVTRSLDLDPAAPIFAGTGEGPYVVTTSDADPAGRTALGAVAELLDAGSGSVDLAAALGELHRRGAGVVLVEGGPSLNGQLIDAGLVDELCLSLAPVLLAGPSRRMADSPAVIEPRGLVLDRVLTDQGMLFLRYLRSAEPPAGAHDR